MVPKSQGGPGLFVSMGGGVERSWKLSDHWYLTGEVQSNGASSALIGHRLSVPRSRRERRFPLRRSHSRARRLRRQQALQSEDRDEHRHHGRSAAHRRRAHAQGGAVPAADARCDRDAESRIRSTTSSRRSCRKTGCAWTSTPAWVSESSAGRFSKVRFVRPAPAARRSRQHCADARRATAAVAAVAA